MSRYGIDYYGAAYYGANTLVDFNASPFKAIPYNYASIQLSWTTPTGSWDYMRLVRNSSGFPVAADDGDILFEDANGDSRTFYLDEGQIPNNIGLKQGLPYYYTIFVRETTYSTWQQAGIAIGVSVKDYNTAVNMYNYLPIILSSQIPHDTSVEQDNDVLKRFLQLFGLNLDLYKTMAENVHNRFDISTLNGLLIPVFMREWGLKYEPELGLKQSRIYLRNATRLYQTKGSKLGLEEYVKAYGGFDNTITMGKNLMLDYNDSSFEESIGSWANVSNTTLVRNTTVDPYYEVLSQSNFPNKQEGVLQITATASADSIFSLSGVTARQYGIPVSQSTAYTFSAYSLANSSTRSVSSTISWYDRDGVLISTESYGTGVTNNTSTWSRSVKTATSPSNAYFAVPTIKVASTAAGEIHYFDALQFEQASSSTFFQDARQIQIVLKATRINELLNPNFEDSTDYWNVDNGTFVLTTSEGYEPSGDYAAPISGGAVEVYALAAGDVTVTSDPMAVASGNDYTFSIYASSLVDGTTYDGTVSISWYDSSETLISTETSDTFTISPAYSRPSVTSAAPNNAVTAVVGFTWTADAVDNEIGLDAALFEQSSFVNSFFDGSNGVASLTDLFWEGSVTNGARSHYYRNRFAVQSRLIDTIPDWITLGSTFELLFAQPD